MRNSKGVSAIMEQVFIMVFGVLILITVVLTFSQLKKDTVEYSAVPQYEAVAQHVHAVVISAQEHMNWAGNGYLGFTIPEKIAGENYIVRVNNTHIRVENFPRTINQTILMAQANITIYGNISSDNAGKIRAYFNASDRAINFTRI